MGAYDRVTFRGKRFDRKTVRAIQHAEYLLGTTVTITQGSYNTSVGASAGTHAGGGAIDIVKPSNKSWTQVQWAFRLAGWAFWHRPESRSWPDHGHGILVGHRRLSDDARKQVQDYYAGLNALANHARDSTARPNPIVPFRYPMPHIILPNVLAEAKKTRGWKPMPGVKHVQRALNLKTGTTLAVDGIFGPKTRAAYGRFEKQVGGDGDGLPAPFAARRLGAARFEIKEK